MIQPDGKQSEVMARVKKMIEARELNQAGGIFEIEKSDGSMWQFDEFTNFMNKPSPDKQSRLDHLYQHAKIIGNQENFEDDFTIVEVALK